MAKPQDTQPFLNSISPTKNHDQREGRNTEDDDDYAETSSPNGCACFRLFCFDRYPRNSSKEERSDHFLFEEREKHHESTTWLASKLKKAKEASEFIAGPKWKNFIRRIGKWFNRGKKKSHNNKFQYDPYSYALNFDDGEDDI